MNKEMKSAFKINFKRIQSDFIYNTIQQIYDYILDTMDMKRLINIYEKLKKNEL